MNWPRRSASGSWEWRAAGGKTKVNNKQPTSVPFYQRPMNTVNNFICMYVRTSLCVRGEGGNDGRNGQRVAGAECQEDSKSSKIDGRWTVISWGKRTLFWPRQGGVGPAEACLLAGLVDWAKRPSWVTVTACYMLYNMHIYIYSMYIHGFWSSGFALGV